MPDTLDIIGFVVSIISLVGLHQLKETVARRLPPRRLQAIQTELAELCELLERIERIGHPNGPGADTIRRLRGSLEELDARLTNTWLDVNKWKAKGVVRRYRHWNERVELSRRCSALSRDVEELRAHLHELPPPHTHAPYHDRDVHAPSSEVSCTTATCESSPTAVSVSSTEAFSSTAASVSPKTPQPSLPDAAPPTSVDALGPTAEADQGDGLKRRSNSLQELLNTADVQSWMPDDLYQYTSAWERDPSMSEQRDYKGSRPRRLRRVTVQKPMSALEWRIRPGLEARIAAMRMAIGVGEDEVQVGE